MTTAIGVIGAGMIGREHLIRLAHMDSVNLVAVADANRDSAQKAALDFGLTNVHSDGAALIDDSGVDAVLIASSGPTHAPYVLQAIKAGKPVFCEKPLATNATDCQRIVEAETAAGRRLVQLGFMRRYDHAYGKLKATINQGRIGRPLLVYSAHRNPDVPPTYTGDMAILDSAVHDFDIVRWILGEDFSSIQVIRPRTNSRAVETIDPLLMILRTTGETVVTVETSVNIAYGYDIRAEVVGETGTAALGEHTPVMIRSEGRGGFDVPEDWRVRFSDAFDKELADWVSSAISGQSAVGPSAWDGLAAALVSTAGVASLTSGRPEPIVMPQKPELYA